MTTRKMFTILLVANLLTVAVVAAAFHAGGIVASPAPRPDDDAERAAAFDPNLVPFVPWYMNYQGILKDSGGSPLTGQHDLTFTIYRWDQGIGYVSIWTETHNDVQLTNGLFNVALGTQGSSLRGDTFAGMGVNGTWDGDLALGIRVDGGTELSPRISLGTVPYAHRAEYVNRFPAPHYDSGWVAKPFGNTTTLNHSLGGNTDNYVVDMQFKDTRNPGSLGIHQFTYGGDADDVMWGPGMWGAWWSNLTTSQITVSWGSMDQGAGAVRIRIWRIE